MLYQILILLNLVLPHSKGVTLTVKTDRPAAIYVNKIYHGLSPRRVVVERGKRYQIRAVDLINSYERTKIVYPRKNQQVKITFNDHFRLISLKRSLSLNYIQHQHYLYPAIFHLNTELKLINCRFEFSYFTLKTTLFGSKAYLSTESIGHQAIFLGNISLTILNHLTMGFKIHPFNASYTTLRGSVIEPVAVAKTRYTLPLELPFSTILFFKTYWTRSETLYDTMLLNDIYRFFEMGIEVSGHF